MLFPIIVALTVSAEPRELPTELWQVAPDNSQRAWFTPPKANEKTRAIILVPGLHVHPLRPALATKPELRDWQKPKSELVKTLAAEFDVFAFGYAQTAPVEEIAQSPGLRDAVAKLKKAGYKEIVLVGHSAGGIIARQFVESDANSGVTKVIAVGSPFAGADAATFKVGYPKVQAPFVKSLTPESRAAWAKANNLVLAKDFEFACVVCKIRRLESDGLVDTRSQWPQDLQELGVPFSLSRVRHTDAMENADTAKMILELAKGKLRRWSPEDTERAKKELFGELKN
jgi:pimeloyl-ACP methyl ester carboxylesterase